MADKTLKTLKSRKDGNIVIEHINAQSLLCHKIEVELMLISREIDVLCISETWLTPNIPDVLLNIYNFDIYRCDYGRGGGVCIYIRNDLKVMQIATNNPNNILVEDVWITVQHRKLPFIIVGAVYRHPHALNESFNYLLEMFKSMILRNKAIFILGDINDDLMCAGSKLSKIIKETKFSQMINKPTRVTLTTASLLDVVITSKPEMIVDFDVLPCEVADHELITAKINLSKPKREPVYKTKRNLKNYSSDELCNMILNETPALNSILLTDNVDDQVNLFTQVFNSCLNMCAPVMTKEIRRPPAPWMTNRIEVEIRNRNNIQIQLKSNRHDITLQRQYKEEKKRVRQIMRKAKADFFNDQFKNCKGNSSKTWSTIKKLIPNQKISSKPIQFEDNRSKAEEFNEFFINVGKKAFEKTQEGIGIDNGEQDELTFPALESNFRPQPETVESIILVIKDLRDTSAYGADEIELRFIRDALSVIAFYITVIVNTSIVTGSFPALWKYANVVPGFKNGDVNDVSNYRPISLLPILSKVLEKIVARQLMTFLETNKLLSNSQHGFRDKLSTETALLKVTDKVYKNIDEKKITLITLCDLSKAFDSVNHTMLLRKMLNLKIDPFWFDNYLGGRTQSVRIDKDISHPLTITFGVPQGSILGPILFLIFVNDMEKMVKNCLLVQYADDAQFIHSEKFEKIGEMVTSAEETLSLAKKYFDKNGLLINAKKTQCIFIGSYQYISRIPNDISIKFDNKTIIPSNHVKNLGLYIDCHMSFEIHINEMCRRVVGTLSYINGIKNNFNKSIRTTVIEALVLSKINYCSRIWGAASRTQIQRVQKLQKNSAKVAHGHARKYDHATPIIKELGWMKVEEKLIYDLCTVIYKILRGELPSWLFSFDTVGQVRGVETRQVNDLFVPRANTTIGSKAIDIRGPLYWNALPCNVKEACSFPTFKKRMKHYIMSSF